MPNENAKFWDGLESEFFGSSAGQAQPTPQVNSYTPQASSSRQILNILFLIDVSGSMRGTRIAQVNYAMENIIKEMRSRDDLNSVIKIGIMEFADRAKWVTPRPLSLDDYVFTSIQAQPWFTCYGKAFSALEEKLHKHAFMDPNAGEYFAPLILFVTDGEPVDLEDYPDQLEKLRRNKWFQKSARYAIAVGEESKGPEIPQLLAQFTGDILNVRHADEGSALCDLIQFITVRASEVQTSIVSDGSTGNSSSIFTSKDDSLFSSMYTTGR